ncbi:Panacea domain-containing protein [Chitinophaga caseinilytica]|uniref:Type II toxin-antitoxin system antitoxin SocA domain-containing protein n=1 Tax=Chitinophaga caseinilytica TaxID=2267521 RepID=A0ABZ2ZAX6_9BACT
MMYTANQIASWFLASLETNSGDTISPMKLQKLIYYSQAWYLVKFDKPLFNDKIEAWMHGPTIPAVYERFDNAYRDSIPFEKMFSKEHPYKKLPIELDDFLEEIFFKYGEHSAWFLEALSKKELPWRMARRHTPSLMHCHQEITQESMKNYYSKLQHEGKP